MSTLPENVKAAIGIHLDEQGRLMDDLYCYSCGYNLRGLAHDGCCTECASAVSESVMEDKLVYRHPAWLRQLSRGASAIWWSIALTIILFVVITAGAMIFSQTGILGGTGRSVVESLMHIAIVALPVLCLLGVVWMTTPDPGALAESEGTSARKLVRYLLIALIVSLLVDFLVGYVGIGALSEAATHVSTVLFVLLVLAWLEHVRQLVLRIPALPVAKACRQLFWFLILLGIATEVEWAGNQWKLFGARHAEIMKALSIAMPILNFVGAIYPLVVIDKASRALKGVIAEAEVLRANTDTSAGQEKLSG